MATTNQIIGSAYRRALHAARARNFAINRAGLGRLYRAFADVLNELAGTDSTSLMTAAEVSRLRGDLEVWLRQLERALIRSTELAVGGTLVDLRDIHQEVTRELVRRYGPEGVTVSASFERIPVRALAAMTSRPNAVTFQTLFHRKIEALAPEIDRYLDASLTAGRSVSRTRKDLARIMSRDDPDLVRLLDRYDAREFDFRAIGLDESDAKAIRELLYDSRRIAATEPNNAFREGTAAAMDESPVVIAAKWQLSGRHHVPCVCDALAETDAFGYGPGMYPPSSWPLAPHPFCSCYSGEVLFRSPSDWDKPKLPPRPLGIDPREPRHTAAWASAWTERERERNQATFTAILAEGQRRRAVA